MLIYAVVNEVNGKAYVGQTTQTLSERKRSHLKAIRAKKGPRGAFQHAVLKYGEDRFTWYELDTCDSYEALNTAEKYFIQYLDTLAPNGYNLDIGGKCGPRSELTRFRIAVAHTGMRHTLKTRKKLSRIFKGKKLSSETRAKMALAAEMRAVKLSKPIELVNATGERRLFPSVAEAARVIGVCQSNLVQVRLGRRKSAGGWRIYSGV